MINLLESAGARTAPGIAPEILASVADHVRDAVLVTTVAVEGGPIIVYVNAAFTAMTGYLAAEVIGSPTSLLHGEATDREEVARLREAMRAGRRGSGVLVNYRRDGSSFCVRVTVIPLRDGEGRITHFLGLMGDAVSERGPALAGQIFQAVLQQASDVLAVLDENGCVTYANRAAIEVSGQTAVDILGRTPRALGLAPRRLRTFRDIIATLADGREWRGEYEASGRNGLPRRLEVAVVPVDSGDPHARFVINARDVTHQRRLEYIAEATNLVENVGYVFAGLRHELGNPVNSIKTALTVVRQGLWTMAPERVEDYLDRVLGELGRVEYLLRSLQSFNTLSRPTLEPVPLGAFVRRFARLVQEDVARREVQLTVEVDDDAAAAAAIADPRALHQVVLNLVTNALDALAGRRDGRIRIAVQRGTDTLRVLVSDNGPGIPQSQRGSVFKPFHTTKAKGSGLGLAITRKLITLMRGTVAIDQAPGWATTFVVTLDSADAPERRYSTQRPPPRIAR